MYKIFESRRGYAIYFINENKKEYISDGLSLKQANKWCERLNKAYDKGYASNW